VWPSLIHETKPSPRSELRLQPLCRNDEQLDAVIEAGMEEVILDWMELVGLRRAFERARQAGLRVGVATVRVQKPLEEGYDRRLAALDPDLVLVRHWAGVMEFADPTKRGRAEIQGDFSLNVTNAVTATHLLDLGLDSVTAAHDLDEAQLLNLLEAFPADRVAVTLHQHIPTFHTEHCVYSHLLSEGRDYRSCGRPCEKHRLGLTDRKGINHPVIVDVGCRNTVFNGKAQSAARLFPALVQKGVKIFRLEFVWEDKAQTLEVLQAYRDLAGGRETPAQALLRIGALEQFGVGLGTMKVLA
jgi:putative protease